MLWKSIDVIIPLTPVTLWPPKGGGAAAGVHAQACEKDDTANWYMLRWWRKEQDMNCERGRTTTAQQGRVRQRRV